MSGPVTEVDVYRRNGRVVCWGEQGCQRRGRCTDNVWLRREGSMQANMCTDERVKRVTKEQDGLIVDDDAS
jgi:hypothetical protein